MPDDYLIFKNKYFNLLDQALKFRNCDVIFQMVDDLLKNNEKIAEYFLLASEDIIKNGLIKDTHNYVDYLDKIDLYDDNHDKKLFRTKFAISKILSDHFYFQYFSKNDLKDFFRDYQ